jgi:hypothetical protein
MQNITAKQPEYERLREQVTAKTIAFRKAGEALD